MNIVSVRSGHIDELLAVYLSQVARAPHCRFVPDRTRFCDDLLGLTPRLRPAPQQSQVLVAEVSGTVCGFATLTTYREDGVEHQAITGLFFQLRLQATPWFTCARPRRLAMNSARSRRRTATRWFKPTMLAGTPSPAISRMLHGC